MKKFIKSRLVLQIAIATLAATFATAGIVAAATTIGSSISTGGTLSVTGASTLTGNVTVSGSIADTLTMAAGKGLVLGTSASDITGAAGMIFFDTTNKVIRLNDGTSWFTVGTSTDGMSLSGNRMQLSSLNYYTTIGTTTQQGLSVLTLEATSTAAIPLTVVARASQSANLVQVANAGGTNLLYIKSNGALFASSTLQVTGVTTLYGNASLDGGTFTFNESSADKDFRFEGNGEAYLLFGDAGNDRIGIGTTTPGYLLDVDGDFRIGEVGNATALTVDAGTGAIVINEDSASTADVRVETDSEANGFMIDASADRIGIATATPWATLSINSRAGDSALVVGSSTATILEIESDFDLNYYSGLIFGDYSAGAIGIGTSTPSSSYLLDVDGDLRIGEVGNANALTIDAGTGAIVINDDSASTADVRVETDSEANGFMIDASADRIGIATATPWATLSINSRAGDSALTIGSTTGTYLEVDNKGDLFVDTDTLYVDNSADRVGISSSTPFGDLAIGTAGATSTISMGRLCWYVEDQKGNKMWVTLNMAAADASAGIFATSSTPCNQ